MSVMDKVKESVTNKVTEQVNLNVNFGKFILKSLAGFTVEEWTITISIVFLLSIIIVNADPFASKLLTYGKNTSNPKIHDPRQETSLLLTKVVNRVLNITVPKSYFQHFYIFFAGIMTLEQFLFYNLENNQFPVVREYTEKIYRSWFAGEYSPDNYTYLYVVNNLLLVHGIKRLYENFFVSKFSNTRINILHYAFGLLYYLLVSSINFAGMAPFYLDGKIHEANLDFQDWIFICVFAFYLIDQFQNHQHLASLKKYTIPTFRLFEFTPSAHYLDEIIMYAILLRFYYVCSEIWGIQASFTGIFLLVAANLSVSAKETFVYYKIKFGEQFTTPYKLVPYVW